MITLIQRNSQTGSKWHIKEGQTARSVWAPCGPGVVIFEKDPNREEKQGTTADVTCLSCRRSGVFKELERDGK